MSINSEALDLTDQFVRIDASKLEIGGTLMTATAAELNAIAGNGLSAAELAVLDGVVAGTVLAGKAVIATTDKHIDTIVITDGGLKLGAGAGTAVSATAAELNYTDITTLGTLAASKAWTSDASLDTVMPTGGKLTVQSGGDITLESGSTLDVAGTFEIANVGMTASAAELNYNDITTLGTLAASKAWTSDASLDTVMPTGGLLTVQSGGAVTLDSGSTLTASGAVIQAPVFVADATPYTVLAANSGKLHIILEQTNTITLNLPVIAAGLSYKFIMGGVATEAQNWVIVATTPSFYNGGVSWDDSNAVASPVPVYGNGTSHLTLTATTPEAGTMIEIYSNGTEWFVHGAVFSVATPAFT